MDLLVSAIGWIFDGSHWKPGSQNPLPIQDRLVEHLLYTAISVGIAALIPCRWASSSGTPAAAASS